MLPEPAARGTFDRGGRWAAGREGKGARQLRANMRVATGGRLADGELDRADRPGLQSYARYWQEAFRLPTLSSERIVAGTEVSGLRVCGAAARRGAGARSWCCRTAGTGTPPASGSSTAWNGPFMTVAERLKPESLYRRCLAYRESLGLPGRAADRRARPSTEVLREWLTRRRARRACWSTGTSAAGECRWSFFGRNARMPGGAALLAGTDRCRAGAHRPQFTEQGWRMCSTPEVPVDGPGRLRPPGRRRDAGGRRRVHRVDRPSTGGLAHARADMGRRPARSGGSDGTRG